MLQKLSEYFHINFKVRAKNKTFWILLVAALFLLIKQVASLFGVILDFDNIVAVVKEIIETIFYILVVLGVNVDPTTKGFSDSTLAMTYDKPKEDK